MKKRSFSLLALLGALSAAAYGQSNPLIIAGGGPPNGSTATSISVSTARGVAVDAAGNLYIAAPSHHRVYVVATNGTVTVLAGTGVPGYSGDGGAATSAQLYIPNAVAVDSTGTNVYIADTNNNRIRKITAGVITTLAGNGVWGYSGDGGAATSAQVSYPGGVTVDSAGNVYIADTNNNRIRKVSGGVITTVAGNGLQGYSGDGGLAANAQISFPKGVAVDGAGNLYIADAGNNRVRKVMGGIISTFAGSGAGGYSGDGGAAVSAQLFFPDGVAADGAGNVYIADTFNSRIRKVTGGVITTVAGNGVYGYGGDGGQATGAWLSQPHAVAVNSTGSDLYIGEQDNRRVRRVRSGIITTVAGNGSVGYSGDGGAAVLAQLVPTGIAIDSAGSFLIADAPDYRIRKVTASGTVTTVAGNGTKGYSGDGGQATSAQIGSTQSVAIDSSGNLYLPDIDHHCVRKVSGGVITTVAGTGTSGYSGDGGLATNAQLNAPGSVVVDNSGNLYIADAGNNRIRKVSGGVITLVAGGGPRDGSVAAAVSMSPAGTAVDSYGDTYVASPLHNRVYRIAANGTLTTVAGTGGPGYSGDGGPATSAQLNQPSGVAVDGAGNVYIADLGNHRVRKVSGGVITTVAGSYSSALGDGGAAVLAQVSLPSAVAVDSAGTNLYIAELINSRVRKVTGGIITTVAGNGTPGYSGDGGAATGAQINYPSGVAVDSAGNLYIADTNNNRIRKVAGGVITTVAGNGGFGYSGDGGAATNASLYGPLGVAVDGTGNLYIADSGSYRVRKVTRGIISTIAGNGYVSYSGDGGAATNAQLTVITGLALDSAGNLYFSDCWNGRVRMISTGGTITTIAGNDSSGYWGDGVLATSTPLSYPSGLAVSGGKVYIVDQGNSRLRVVSGGVIDTVAMLPGLSSSADTSLGGSVVVDSAGRVYASNPAAGTVSQVAGGSGAVFGLSWTYGQFTQGQANATYSLIIANNGSGPTTGTVTVTNTLLGGLTLVSMAGTGWSCTGNTCTCADVLRPGANYPGITVTVNVAADASSVVPVLVAVSESGATTTMALSIPTHSATPPSAASVTPASGSGNSQTFSFVYSDGAGASDLASAYASINNGVTACMVQADLAHGWLYLLNDAMTGWAGPITVGTATSLQNSQCTVNAAGSSIALSGTQAALNVALTFTPAFAGAKNVYGYAQTAGGLNSGWILLGNWTVTGTQSPHAVSVAPSSGNRSTQTFSFVYSDPYGAANLTAAYAAINDGVTSCMVQADLVHGTLYLQNDMQTAWLGPITMGSGALQNSQCTVSGSGSSVLLSGNQVTLNLALTFSPNYPGAKQVFGYVQNSGGLNSGWVALGTWTVPGVTPPSVQLGSVSQSGSAYLFTFLYADGSGGSNLASLYASINDGSKSCMVQVDQLHGVWYLLDDTMTTWLGPAAGATQLQNSQCAVSAASVLAGAGAPISLTLAMTFKPAFAGTKNIYGYAQSPDGLNSGWVSLGSWVVPAGQAPQVVSVTPSSGSGSSQIFTLVYLDAAGSTDLAAGYVSINNGVTGCQVQADLMHGWLYLLNDAQTGWLGPIATGTATTLQNNQCTVNGTGSSAVLSGNQVTLSVNLAFKPAFAGTKNVFGYAQTAGGLNTGWVSLGTWTVTGTQAPQAVSVTPSSGSGSSRTFSAVYSDAYGGSNLTSGYLSINDGVKACMVQTDLLHGWLYLLNDAMTGWLGPIAAGAATTVQNSQCTVSGTGSSVVVSGNQATVSLNLAFKPAFAGVKSVFGYAQNAGGLNSGWIALGTWTAQ